MAELPQIPEPPEGTRPMVGDHVLIRAEVVRVQPGVGLLVELFSKTDQYHAWVREDLVEGRVTMEELPPEPADGTWLRGKENPDTGNASVFARIDSEGHFDTHGGGSARRFDRRWWDYAASEWIDWLEAFRRGADPQCPLYTPEVLEQAIADGGYEQIGDHRIALGSGTCVVHGEHYELPHELNRLRQRTAEEDRAC